MGRVPRLIYGLNSGARDVPEEVFGVDGRHEPVLGAPDQESVDNIKAIVSHGRPRLGPIPAWARQIFSATTRRRSADWDAYDKIAEADKRVAMILRPEHVYGSALAKMREAAAK